MTRIVKRFSIRRMEYEWILQSYDVIAGGMDYEIIWRDVRVLTKLERSLL